MRTTCKFLEIEKAFDDVEQQFFLKKCSIYGILTRVLNLISVIKCNVLELEKH